MPETSGRGRSEGADPSAEAAPNEDLPRNLVLGQIIPPPPNRSKSAVDWIHDFGGFSWIAYGASSILVISHCPSPTPGERSFAGPLFKQIIEPSPWSPAWYSAGDDRPLVKAVAWCHSHPSDGGIAASLGDQVFVYHPNSSRGPLRWEQKAVLLHPFVVQAIEWTKSGDGLVAVGNGVVSWKKERSSWMIAWKSQPSVAQSLVSTTWFTSGPVATMAYQLESLETFSTSEDASFKVLVFLEECKDQVMKLELCHPRPVSMIQWRPASKKLSCSWRDILLTCCMDGAVRLWGEVGCGLGKRFPCDDNDRNHPRRSFHVISVIEMIHCSKGIVGQDTFVFWATESWGGFPNSNRSEPYFSVSCPPSDHVGGCDWLISVGPEFSLSLFSVHCLDDLFPLRFPRIKLWRKFQMEDIRSEESSNLKNFTRNGEPLLLKSIIWRNSPYGPPVECSVLRLSANYTIIWSRFSGPFPETTDEKTLNNVKKEKISSDYIENCLSEACHADKILQVSVHPCCTDMEVFVSLDSNGFLLFWSFSEIESVPGPEMISDTECQFIGKINTDDISNAARYLTLAWAPSIICGNRFLLLGGPEGIDCIVTNIPGVRKNKILYHKLFSISFSDLNIRYGPDCMSTIPLASTCELSHSLDSFMVVAASRKEFKVFSWKVVLQSDDGRPSTTSLGCLSTDSYLSKSTGWKYESYFGGRRYLVAIDLCANQFSDCSSITCFAVLSPEISYSSASCVAPSSKRIHKSSSLYHIVTGHSDGIIRLWRSAALKSIDQFSDETCSPWELVGLFHALCGSVCSVALSACGTKVAVASKESSSKTIIVSIWHFICLSGGGGFIEEGKVSLHGDIVGLKWATLGNGHSMLAVCLPNKFCLYSPKRYLDSKSEKYGRLMNLQEWVPVACSQSKSSVQDFAWGPGLRLILVHAKHLSVFSQWSARYHCHTDSHADNVHISSEESPCVVFCQNESSVIKKMLRPQDCLEDGSFTYSNSCSLSRLANECFLSLPSCHPQAILAQLFSGNWKGAYGMVRHLTGYLSSGNDKSPRSNLFIPEIKYSEYLGGKDNVVRRSDGFQWGHGTSRGEYNNNKSSTPVGSEIMAFIDAVEKSKQVRTLMNIDSNELLAAVDLLGEIVEPRNTSIFESFDRPGRRFWVSLQFQRFCSFRKTGKFDIREDMQADSSMIAWAFLSESQTSFISSLLSADSSWKEMKNIGIGFWLTDAVQLRSMEDRNKLAALKNAYVLMGKHQLELAVAFFLLGGDVSSAVNVCAKNLGDEQLALLICRLVQGYGGSLENELVTNILLPNAIQKNDFWLASVLELSLGNWTNSFKRLLALNADVQHYELQYSSITFLDANISEYLEMLSTKIGLRAAVGDHQSSVLSNWAKSMRIIASFRSGFSLEALDSTSSSSYEGKGPLTMVKENHLSGINPISDYGCNWVAEDVAISLDHKFKLNIAMQYLSKLVMEHIWEENQEKMAKSASHIWFAVSKLAEKYSIDLVELMNLIFLYANNHMFLSLGYHVVLQATSQNFSEDVELLNRLGKSMEEICIFVSRYVSLIGFTNTVKVSDCRPSSSKIMNSQSNDTSSTLRRIIKYLTGFKLLLCSSACKTSHILDFLEIFLHLSLAWVCKDLKLLTLLTLPILNSVNGKESFPDVSEFLRQTSSFAVLSASTNHEEVNLESLHDECPSNHLLCLPPDDEQWLLISFSLWRKFSAFFRKELGLLSFESNEDDSIASFHPDLLISSLDYISSTLKRYLRSLLNRKVELGEIVGIFGWLHKYKESGPNMSTLQLTEDVNEKSLLQKLWTISVDHEEIQACFSAEEINFFHSDRTKQNVVWNDIIGGLLPESSNDDEQRQNSSVSIRGNIFYDSHEMYKKNGELFEAISINSTDESQVALASNRKGLVFLNWKTTNFPKSQAQSIWMDCDWPEEGWAGSESTPIPTYVSPGIGLGSRRGAHLGLGGATVGRDLTAFGAFGVPGYAGVAASGLGWGEQSDFEDFKDPPATVDNIRTRALSSHPSKPLFLVGSSNTHVYLWEFGKEKATATYGVLPAANVPPPYALASISDVQFDTYGQRFATVALDGTVCTWQLEVGGRSNVHPVGSSLCFNKHASAVAFIAGSGSIIAAAGHNTTNANVVIWDTLVPPSASHTFLTCHEGGARSLSVFDNDIGFGLMCPLLITGGNNGDIALYDIRYVMYGKNGMIWQEPSAHQGSVTKIVPVPSTSLILTGGKDGDVKLWDARRCEMLFHWKKMHERHTFLQPSSRGYGGIARAAVTDIQVVSGGFLTCGGDGSVKFVKLSDPARGI
ncbi:transducin family protein / WD-40 repeat family protein isoform X2 [Wolffia australiana]